MYFTIKLSRGGRHSPYAQELFKKMLKFRKTLLSKLSHKTCSRKKIRKG